MKQKITLIVTFLLCAIFMITGCKSSKEADILNEFNNISDNEITNDYSSEVPLTYANAFASNLAVANDEDGNTEGSENLHSKSALLIDVTEGEVLFQKDPHLKIYPASTTKLLTAIVALKYGDKSKSYTIKEPIIFNEGNVIICDFRQGDSVPFNVMLNGALLKSGNDAAIAMALSVSDSIKDFSTLMNEEAKSLGATESNFVNPHGLFDENHYSTAYDMYLIFNEAIKYPEIVDTLSTPVFNSSFNRKTDYGDYIINCTYNNTNKYVTGEKTAPSGITVIGGKAGYTELARRNYVMLAKANGHQYILVVMKNNSVDETYEDLDYLLSKIPTK